MERVEESWKVNSRSGRRWGKKRKFKSQDPSTFFFFAPAELMEILGGKS